MTKISITRRALQWRESVRFDITYPLSPCGDAMSATLVDPEIGEITGLAAPRGMAVRGARVSGEAQLEIARGTHASFNGAELLVRVKWDRRAIARLKGSHACVLPTGLPRLLAEHGADLGSSQPLPVSVSKAPRFELHPPVPPTAGCVTDLAGELLMAALPVGRRLQDAIWYADDAIVLAGEGPKSISVQHRTALQFRLLEIHRFLDAEFGQGRHVRALVLCDSGAKDYLHGPGQIVALEDTRIDSTPDYSWFLAERIVVQEMASMWWAYGVRPRGVGGPEMGAAFAIYAILRWFEVTRKHDELASELALWQEKIETIERIGVESSPVVWRSARVALALYAHNSSALRDEIRRWCATDWGCAVPVETLVERLASIGVELPK